MVRRFSAIAVVANASLAVAASSAVVLGGVSAASSVAPAAYQGGAATVVTVSVVPSAPQDTCVLVHVSVSSDASQPTGSVNFSIDGSIADSRTVPSGGAFTETVNCGAAGAVSRVLHGTVAGDSVQNVAFVTAASTGTALSVGTHVLTAAYVPTGNFQPSQGSANLAITGAMTGTGTGTVTGVDAGLATYKQAGAGSGADLRAAISGTAMALALGVIAVYRRRATR